MYRKRQEIDYLGNLYDKYLLLFFFYNFIHNDMIVDMKINVSLHKLYEVIYFELSCLFIVLKTNVSYYHFNKYLNFLIKLHIIVLSCKLNSLIMKYVLDQINTFFLFLLLCFMYYVYTFSFLRV